MTYNEINEKFTSFVNQMMMLRLINSGKSNMSKEQGELVQKAFNDAYQIMLIAKDKQNTELFNRVYLMAQKLVPNAEIIKVMKYPEMYNDMCNAHMEFNANVATLLRQNPSFVAKMRERCK